MSKMNGLKCVACASPNGKPRESGGIDGKSGWARLLLLVVMVAIMAAARLFPHLPNFTPIGAMALFGGACFSTRKLAFGVPLLSLFVSDLVLGFHLLMPIVYGSFAVNVLLGRWLRSRRRFLPIALATLLGAIQFFVVTNFACWLFYYPHTWSGLTECFVGALPFFRNSLLGDGVYCGVLFGGLALAESGFPVFRERAAVATA